MTQDQKYLLVVVFSIAVAGSRNAETDGRVSKRSLLNAKDVLKPGSTPFDVTWKTHEGDQEPKTDFFNFFFYTSC